MKTNSILKSIMQGPVLLAKGLIMVYRYLISPLFAVSCRFDPSCSYYALKALDQYGLIKGGGMAVRRILRCHPWNPGGYDPVDPPVRVHHKHTINTP